MNELQNAKHFMLEHHLQGRDIADPQVLSAMETVPREAFVREDQIDSAYADRPLPAGENQTISQPYIVALMAQALELSPEDSVLDVGSGTGYAAAVLSRMVRQVYAIEYHESLVVAAEARCRSLEYDNIRFMTGDGRQGWPDFAPFDAIHVAACTPTIPGALTDQLAPNGRLVLPLGSSGSSQRLVQYRYRQGRLQEKSLCHVRFVPLIESLP